MSGQSVVLTDEELVERVQAGDVEAFGALVERYEDRLLRYARKFLYEHMEAQDCVQNAFLKAYENIKSFNSSHKFSPWLYRIAHNEFVDVLRKHGREPVSVLDPDTVFPHPMASERTDRDAEQREVRELLNRYLSQLEPRYREPLVLHYFEDMNYRDIADILRIPTSTVGVRLKRGRERMMRLMQEKS